MTPTQLGTHATQSTFTWEQQRRTHHTACVTAINGSHHHVATWQDGEGGRSALCLYLGQPTKDVARSTPMFVEEGEARAMVQLLKAYLGE